MIRGNLLETRGPVVTRYRGDAWGRIASDLLCGVADATQGVSIVVIAAGDTVAATEVQAADVEEWTTRQPHDSDMSYWRKLMDGSWLFVPMSRDAVENVMAWTMPSLDVTSGNVASKSQSIVLESSTWQDLHIGELVCSTDLHFADIEECFRDIALFRFNWTYSFWQFHPGRHSLDHLIRLVDPVVSRVNSTLL